MTGRPDKVLPDLRRRVDAAARPSAPELNQNQTWKTQKGSVQHFTLKSFTL